MPLSLLKNSPKRANHPRRRYTMRAGTVMVTAVPEGVTAQICSRAWIFTARSRILFRPKCPIFPVLSTSGAMPTPSSRIEISKKKRIDRQSDFNY